MTGRHHFTHIRGILLWSLAAILSAASLFSVWATYQLMTAPTVVAAGAADATSEQRNPIPLREPIYIKFDKPIDHRLLSPEISPAISGSWRFEDSLFMGEFYQAVSFTPEKYFEPGKEYTITLQNVSPVLGNNEAEYVYRFTAESIPTVAASETGGQKIGICDPIFFTLNSPNANIAQFVPTLSPAVDLDVELQSDQLTYLAKPRRCLDQGTPYTLTVARAVTLYDANNTLIVRSDPEPVFTTTFETKGSPGVTEFSPKGSQILTDTKELRLTFSEAMNRNDVEQSIQITPAAAGSWNWESDTVLRYALSEPLQFATTYTVLLPQGTQDAKQGYLPEEARFSFDTIGHAEVAGISPKNGSREVSAATTVTVQFDQAVDHPSAEAAFSISPQTTGSFSWQGNKMVFKPAALNKDSTYTVTIDKGVKSIHGLATVAGASSSFTTQQSVTLLNVPMDLQDYALSCEIASLKMVLTYRGIRVSEDDILDKIGYDTTPRTDTTWGDPDVAFVGSVRGKQNSTGYGVHWAPIARAATAYRSASAFSGWNPTQLADAIQKGNPVVIWGTQGRASYSPWQTPSGKTVPAWVGEHARVVVGFKGSVENPQYFILNDPIHGRLTWTTSQLRNNWGAFNYSGVVVY